MAIGAAIAERFMVQRFGEWMVHKTYAFISDGGVQEEISQSGGRVAGFLGLNNLIMFYDSNGIQLSTETKDVTNEDTVKKYEAWGWKVITIEGKNIEAIRSALKVAQAEKEKPTMIIGKTIMGKGALKEDGSSFEGQSVTHGMPLGKSGASFDKTILNLGGDPKNPFVIFDDVQEMFDVHKKELIAAAAQKKAAQKVWEKANPESAAKLKKFFSKSVPEFDFSKIVQKSGSSTHAASSTVFAAFASEIENMIVSSADLSNSDKTDGFLK